MSEEAVKQFLVKGNKLTGWITLTKESGIPAKNLTTIEEDLQFILDQGLGKPFVEGDVWYLVSTPWIDRLKERLEGDEVDQHALVQLLGPVDNGPILGNAGTSDNLKPDLLEDNDYVLVSKECWMELEKRFGTMPSQTPISRRVIKQGYLIEHFMVEVYLPEFILGLRSKPDYTVRRKYSRLDPVKVIVNDMKELFGIPDQVKTKLFAKHNPTKYTELNTEDNLVEDLSINSGQLILIECVEIFHRNIVHFNSAWYV